MILTLEIEAKLKLASHELVKEKLMKSDAEFLFILRQIDYYFDNDESDVVANDQCLRLRCEKTEEGCRAGDQVTVLCFKGAKGIGRYKSREEIETGVSELEATIEILERLGYKKKLGFDKVREVWLFEKCQICMDRLPLIGSYIEIEGESEEQVWLAQKKLGLEKIQHEEKSYACLIDEELKKTGDNKTEVFL